MRSLKKIINNDESGDSCPVWQSFHHDFEAISDNIEFLFGHFRATIDNAKCFFAG